MKRKKELKKPPTLTETLCKEANPMALRGILNFLEVCRVGSPSDILDDTEELEGDSQDTAMTPPLPPEDNASSEPSVLKGYPYLIEMLSRLEVLPVFVAGCVSADNVRREDTSCFLNPYYCDGGNSAALSALEAHGCVEHILPAREADKANKPAYYEITEKGREVLAELVKMPGTIRNFTEEERAEREAAARRQLGVPGLKPARFEREGDSAPALEKTGALVHAHGAAAALPVATSRMIVEAAPPEKPKDPPHRPPAKVKKKKRSDHHDASALRPSGGIPAQKLRAEQAALTFLRWKKSTDAKSAFRERDLILTLSSHVDESGWSGGADKMNAFRSTINIGYDVLREMRTRENPPIVFGSMGRPDGDIYCYITDAGMTRLQELEAQAARHQSEEKPKGVA